jgi:PIN domain nuclease of toxin-antitoxin system
VEYLLDTHSILWFFESPKKLSQLAYDVIINSDNIIYVSIASVWEVTIKISIGKLALKSSFNRFCEMIGENGFELRPIEFSHLQKLQDLPFLHRDPFDRLLIATAASEGMGLVTADEHIQLYDVDCVW